MVAVLAIFATMMMPRTNNMLRSRRKDKDIRPNRLLDRVASRGMLYENEGLRMRTINISADLEKGQQYIKKLRRENYQLRREIWNLRDQYDKLESLLKNQDQNQITIEELDSDAKEDSLSIVEEENENEDNTRADNEIEVRENGNNMGCRNESFAGADIEFANMLDDMTKQITNTLNVGTVIELVTVTSDITTKNDVNQFDALFENEMCNGRENDKMRSMRKCDDFVKVFRDNTAEHHTLVFSTDDFENLTVQNIIDEFEQQLEDECQNIIKGVRLTAKNCYITVNSAEYCKTLLNAGLKIRDTPITLSNIWDNSMILQLSSVPHYAHDDEIISLISRFTDVIGNVERQTYKGLDTGERFVHVKSRENIPDQMLVGSTCIDLNVIYPITEFKNIARRKSFRSQININLKTPQENESTDAAAECNSIPAATEQPSAPKSEPSFFAKSTGVVLSSAEIENKTNVFQFPTPQPIQMTSKKKPNKEKPVSESPISFRKFSQRRKETFRKTNSADISQPPSPVPFQNAKSARRPSVNFKHNSGRDHSNEYFPSYRERSTSDASSKISICRRKLSITGHEGTGKIPWCGCWGIGCC